jgi:ribosome-binding protein aMBF1 (putative translation factor)
MCAICPSTEATRHINLYVNGSEGLNVCHNCEMKIVEYVRELSNINLRKSLEEFKEKHLKTR